MTRGTRIVAIDAGEPQSSQAPEVVAEPATVAEQTEAESWDAEPENAARSGMAAVALAVTAVAVLGWTALFVMANLPGMQAGASLQQWTNWLRDWAVPVLLIAVLWLIAMRNSRREALRFGQTAQLLSAESARLETRLTTVNRELSLAREFISAQARDIESVGRIASERLSAHAERLTSLIADNGSRLDSIQTVSAAALDNMETLRGHLPVIASSAKDVSNNIGAAGRAASAQLDELVAGFARLDESAQTTESQVNALRATVDGALSDFTRQTDHLSEIADRRFAALGERSLEFRTQLDAHEVEALAAIRSRASVLVEELEDARKILDVQESDILTSLRARLNAIRDESGALVRTLRETENTSLEAWKIAIVQLEDGLTSAIAKVAEIDSKTMASSRQRLAELAKEAADIDHRMNESDQLFAAELERRRTAFEDRHTQFITRLSEQLQNLDTQITERQLSQEDHGRKLVAQSKSVVDQFAELARRLDEVVSLGGDAETRVAQGLTALGEKLSASREALNGTDAAIAELTDGSVRLLELIQASVQHSTRDLPEAMGVSEARLAGVENRVTNLKTALAAAEQSGDRIALHINRGNTNLDQALARIEALSTKVEADGSRQMVTLEEMASALENVREESLKLAEQAQGELKRAIAELDQSAKDAVAAIGTLSAEALTKLAARLSEESTAAIETAMQDRADEVVGQLDLAAASAAEVSREAAIQLRDQLAKVSELTNHLEQRVAHARARAEEQVDSDFARRVALITESLNSNAIDIARAMDTEVTDMAWSAYLKGDRGIFTRRSVRLLDAGEAKAIAQFYESDRNFRDHVSRYIHDFESMLRQLLSTRDGHALGVTLLSSDMGKLYVALAQAIERLRN